MRSVPAILGLAFVLSCGGTSANPIENAGDSKGDGGGSTSGGSTSGGSGSGGGESSSGASGGGDGTSSSGGSSSGASSSGGSSSGASSGGDAGSNPPAETGGGTTPSMLPAVSGTCPTITTGQLTFAGEPVEIWAGSSTPAKPGPLVMFWFETTGNSTNVTQQFGMSEISQVTAEGGIVASFGNPSGTGQTNMQGTDTGDAVWFTGDFATADQVVACAIQQKRIDPSRIYSMGASAGALQTTWMSYARSGYLAAVATLSGGVTGIGSTYPAYPTEEVLQDPSHIPAALVTHGSEAMDSVFGDNFADGSAAWESDIAKKSGFSVDCDTGAGHVSGPPAICPGILQFFEDHPFGVKQDYASGLPSVFPSYCKIGPQPAK